MTCSFNKLVLWHCWVIKSTMQLYKPFLAAWWHHSKLKPLKRMCKPMPMMKNNVNQQAKRRYVREASIRGLREGEEIGNWYRGMHERWLQFLRNFFLITVWDVVGVLPFFCFLLFSLINNHNYFQIYFFPFFHFSPSVWDGRLLTHYHNVQLFSLH